MISASKLRQSPLLPLIGLLLLIVSVLVFSAFETWRLNSVVAISKHKIITLLPLTAALNLAAMRATTQTMQHLRFARLAQTLPALRAVQLKQTETALRTRNILSSEFSSALRELQRVREEKEIEPYPELAVMEQVILHLKELNLQVKREITAPFSPVTTSRISALLLEIDRGLDELDEQTARVTRRNLAYGESSRLAATRDMYVFGGLVLLIGLALALHIRKLQRNLMEAETLSVVGKMAITLSHEINNPLAAILGNTHLLLNHPLTPEQVREMTLSVDQSARRIAEVVRRVGEIDRIATTIIPGGSEMLKLNSLDK